MPERIRDKSPFEKLTALMQILRRECPWDRKQTLSSLRHYTLEEAHEVLEAIDAAVEHDDWDKLKEELGDLLLQVAFYACIAEEHGRFNLADVIDALAEKMIQRHPHVFAAVASVDVEAQWQRLKAAEQPGRKSLMDGIPPLPALAFARKLQQRAASVGFDWQEAAAVIDKMQEELDELAHEVKARAEQGRIEAEFGDVLFTLVNLARKLDIDAELALMRTNRSFMQRFRIMEKLADKKGKALEELSLGELEMLYAEAKRYQAGPASRL